tara:strand:+ start:304 stop:1758 length:1455 start_codon:yes stop_codon:yes gene_type:complete
MRILYTPLITAADLNVCSTIQSSKVFIFHLLETYKNAIVYVVIPSKVRAGSQLEHPRLKIIEADVWRQRQQFEMRYVEPKLAQFWDDGENFIDIVISDKMPSMGYLKGFLSGLTGCVGGQSERLYVSLVQFVLSKHLHGYVDEHILMAQSEGLIHSDLIFYQCDSQLDRLKREAMKYVAPSQLLSALGRSERAIPVADFDSLPKPSEKQAEPIIMNYAVGMNANYHIEELFNIMDGVYKGGRNVELQINTPSDVMIWEEVHDIPKKYSHARWTRNLPYAEWIEQIQRGHLFMYDSEAGDVSATILTQQLLGQIGLFRSGRYWEKDYIFDGYPYVFSNNKQASVLIRHLVDNYFSDEIQGVIRQQIEFIHAKYDRQNNPSHLVETMVEALVARKKRAKGSISYRLLKKYAEGKSLISWKELVKFMRAESEKNISINKATGRYGRSPGVWRDAMILMGFSDVGAEGGTLFQRQGDSIDDLHEMRLL